MSAKYKAELKDEKSHEIEILDNGFVIDGSKIELDIAKVGAKSWNVLHENRSFNIELLSFDANTKKVELSVNGVARTVRIKNQLDLLLDKMGISEIGNSKMEDVRAPMPGLVLQILVEESQTIKAGDPLLILEAMKMENIIKAGGDGTIKAILVKNQDIVEKNDVLIEVE